MQKSLFTDTYIAMAKAAEEIQALKPSISSDLQDSPDMGSFFHSSVSLEMLHWDNDEGRWMIGGYNSDDDEDWPWLPRLDQLLGMLDRSRDYAAALHCLADDLSDGGDWCEVVLTHIMISKYGKAWMDGKWTKI